MEAGYAKRFKLTEEHMLKIAKGEKNNVFEIMDQAGELLKNSLLTRSTGHKKHDFSSIQTYSSLRLTELYRDLRHAIKKPEDSQKDWNDLNDETQREILKSAKTKIDKLYSELRSLYKNISDAYPGSTREFFKQSKAEQLKKIKNVFKKLQDRGNLDKRMVFSEKSNEKEGESIQMFGTEMASEILLPVGVTFTVVGAATGSTALMGIGIPLIPLFLVSAALLYFKRDSFGAISNKRVDIHITKKYNRAIKKLNELEIYLEDQVLKATNKKAEEVKIDDVRGIIKEFLSNQKEDWGHYETAANREYILIKSKKDKKQGKHISGLLHVSNEKSSTIGKLKQGLATQWCNIEIDD